MSFQVLYVYAPGTFNISGRVDGFAAGFVSTTFKPGAPAKLPAGVYRTSAATAITPTHEGDFEIVVHTLVKLADGTKDPQPEPPPRALEMLGFGAVEARQFLSGLGDEETF